MHPVGTGLPLMFRHRATSFRIVGERNGISGLTIQQNVAAETATVADSPGIYWLLMKSYRWIVLGAIGTLALTATIELAMGRLPFGPDGKFGLWEGNIWSSELSQRFADPYSLSHVIHGVMIYALLWLVARKVPVRYRFLIAVVLEACWEVLENSPIIIDRYRAVTISLGYVGDSVLNSLSDVLMMAIGFLIAQYARPRTSISLVVLIEIGMLIWVRDNLTLNILMLTYPIEAIKNWQLGGQPVH